MSARRTEVCCLLPAECSLYNIYTGPLLVMLMDPPVAFRVSIKLVAALEMGNSCL